MKKFCLIILALAGILFSCISDIDTVHESAAEATTSEILAGQESESTSYVKSEYSLQEIYLLEFEENIDCETLLKNKEISDEITRIIETEIGLETHSYSYTIDIEKGSRYPFVFTVSSNSDEWHYSFALGVLKYGNNSTIDYSITKDETISYYGDKYQNDELLCISPYCPAIYKNRLIDEISKLFNADIDIRYEGMTYEDKRITIPVISEKTLYIIRTDIKRIDRNEYYTIVDYEAINLDELSPFDFLINKKTFGLSPIDVIEIQSDLSNKMKDELSAELGVTFNKNDYSLISSEFGDTPYIRLTNEDNQDFNKRFLLFNKNTGENYSSANITETTAWCELEWKAISPYSNVEDETISGMQNEESITHESSPTITENVIPQTAYSQSNVLTEQLIQYVMRKEWLEGNYTCLPEDIFHFITTLRAYVNMDNEYHPYINLMSLSQDKRYCMMDLFKVQKIAFELFGYENWTAISYPNELFDETSQTYIMSLEAGIWISGYSFQNMKVSHSENYIYVECEIINSSLYEDEECTYGVYQFIYEYITSNEDSYLRLIGIEHQE